MDLVNVNHVPQNTPITSAANIKAENSTAFNFMIRTNFKNVAVLGEGDLLQNLYKYPSKVKNLVLLYDQTFPRNKSFRYEGYSRNRN